MNEKMKLISHWLDATGVRATGVTPAGVETALRDLLNAVGDLDPLQDEDSLYRYPVPLLSEDGSCSLVDDLAPLPYDLSAILGGRSADATRKLRMVQQLVERATLVTGSDWLGVYQKRSTRDGDPVLVKLAYRGRPSRAEFPLTQEFARGSTNSTVGLTGMAKVIDDVAAHVQQGGAFYVCDDAVQSEACLPILNAAGNDVLGILDAEASPKHFYTVERLTLLSAACLVMPSLLP